jgi:chromosome segregation ATPase
MTSNNDLIGKFLEEMPSMVSAFIKQSQARERLENIHRHNAYRMKFFAQDEESKRVDEAQAKKHETMLQLANVQVLEHVASLRELLRTGLARAQSSASDDLATKVEVKNLKDQITRLLSKGKEREDQFVKLSERVDFLELERNKNSETAKTVSTISVCLSDRTRRLKDLEAENTSLRQGIESMKKGITLAQHNAAAANEKASEVAKNIKNLKTDTEGSVTGLVKDLGELKPVVDKCKTLPAEFAAFKLDVNQSQSTVKEDIATLKSDLKELDDASALATAKLDQRMSKSFEAHSTGAETLQTRLEIIEKDVRERGVSVPAPTRVSDKTIRDLEATVAGQQSRLSDLQDMLEKGIEDVDTGKRHPSIVEIQLQIERRLDVVEVLTPRLDGLANQVSALEAKLGLSSNSLLLPETTSTLFNRIASLEKDKDLRDKELDKALEQRYDPGSLDTRLKTFAKASLANTKALQSMVDGSKKLRKEVEDLKARVHHSATASDTALSATTSAAASDAVIATIRSDLQNQFLFDITNLRQDMDAQFNTATTRHRATRQAVQSLEQRYDSLNSTSLALQILDQLKPRALAEMDPVIREHENSLIAMCSELAELRGLVNKYETDLQNVRQEQAVNQDRRKTDVDTVGGLSATEIDVKLETWFAEAKDQFIHEVGDQINKRVPDNDIQTKIHALEARIITELKELSRVQDVKKLEDRVQDLENPERQSVTLDDCNSKIEHLQRQVDEIRTQHLKLITSGEGIRIRGQSAKRASMQPPMQTQQPFNAMFNPVEYRRPATPPSAEQRNDTKTRTTSETKSFRSPRLGQRSEERKRERPRSNHFD